MDKIAIQDKIHHIKQEWISEKVQKDIQKSTFKSKYLVKFLKNRVEFDPVIINVYLDAENLDK